MKKDRYREHRLFINKIPVDRILRESAIFSRFLRKLHSISLFPVGWPYVSLQSNSSQAAFIARILWRLKRAMAANCLIVTLSGLCLQPSVFHLPQHLGMVLGRY